MKKYIALALTLLIGIAIPTPSQAKSDINIRLDGVRSNPTFLSILPTLSS